MAIAIKKEELKHQIEVLGWKREQIKEHYGFKTMAAVNRMIKATGFRFKAYRPGDDFEFVEEEKSQEVVVESVVEEEVLNTPLASEYQQLEEQIQAGEQSIQQAQPTSNGTWLTDQN